MNKSANRDISNISKYLYPSIVEYKMNSIQKDISYSPVVNGEIKELTVNLLEASKPIIKKDSEFLKRVAKCVQIWEEDNITIKLKEEMLSYYASKKDVCELYLCRNNQIISFIVVMEDSTSDTVFEYNEFGFELSGKYQEIEDFMIIDVEEAEGCLGLLKNYNLIYRRG